LTYLLDKIDDDRDSIELLDIMNQSGITKSLIGLLACKSISTLHSSLRAIGNILTANDRYTEKCVEFGLLPFLYKWLNQLYNANINDHKLKEICWALSNITAGTNKQIIAVIQSNVFPVVINILQRSRTNIANEALWAIANATSSNNSEIIGYLFAQGLVKAFCAYFKNRFFPYNKSLDKILVVALECIESLLFLSDGSNANNSNNGKRKAVNDSVAVQFEENGGLTFLESLQSDDKISEQIYEKVIHIIKCLGVDEEENIIELKGDTNGMEEFVDISCKTKDNQFGFGLNIPQKQRNSFEF